MDGTSRSLERLAEQHGKTERVLNWLMFLGGIAIAALSSVIELPGGLFADKVVALLFRFLAIAVLFYVLAFRAGATIFAMRHTSWWELLLAVAFSGYQAFDLGRTFHLVFVKSLAQGEAPSIAQRVYDALPGSDAVKLALIYAVLGLAVLLVFVGFLFLSACVIRLLKETIRTTVHQLDYPDFTPTLSLGRRMLIGAGLACVTALCCFLVLNNGQEWGSDYAVYLSQAMKLATGQTAGITAVWGYSALLAPIYLLFGYDRVDFSSVIYYKIPAVICLALLAFVLFLFFSKRFKPLFALALTMIFGLSPMFVTDTNQILTNIPHLLFSMLSILCLYQLFEERKLAKQIAYAVFAGIFIGISDLIRVNGIVLLLTLACAHVVCLVSWLLRKNKFFNGLYQRMPIRNIVVHALPYLVYFLFTKFVSAQLFASGAGLGAQAGGLTAGAQSFAYAVQGGTQAGVTFAWFLNSIGYYWQYLSGFLFEQMPFGAFVTQIAFLFIPLLVIGLVRSFRKELISVIYLFGTLAMLCLVLFRQGIRYAFPILPMLVLFLAVGLKSFFDTAAAYTQKPKLVQGIFRVAAVLVGVSFLVATSFSAVANLKANREFDMYSFSSDAKDVYRYIINQTDEDSVIVFIKPVVIELNTEHTSTLDIPAKIDADTYLLITSEGPGEHQLTDAAEFGSIDNLAKEKGLRYELTYQNPRFELYQLFD